MNKSVTSKASCSLSKAGSRAALLIARIAPVVEAREGLRIAATGEHIDITSNDKRTEFTQGLKRHAGQGIFRYFCECDEGRGEWARER